MSRCGGVLLAVVLLGVSLLAAAASSVGGSSSYLWETQEALGDAAIVLEIDGSSGTSCNVHVELAGWMDDHGVVELVYLWEWDNGESDWLHGSHGDEVHAFVAPLVDTRGAPSSIQEIWASSTNLPLPVRGGVSLTIAVPGLEPWPDDIEGGEYSARIQLDCSNTVTASLLGGREVQILTTRNAETGTGVWSPAGNAGAANLVTGDYTADDVRIRAGSEGLQAGSLVAAGPGVVEAWPLLPGERETFKADGGAGSYLLALNRAGGLEEDFWSVLMGLHPVSDLDEIAGLPTLDR